MLSSPVLATELHEAIKANDFNAVKLLLAGDPKKKLLGKSDKDGRLPVHLAVIKNNREILDYIVVGNADIDPGDKIGMTPLMHAVSMGNVEMTKHLMKIGADPSLSSKDGNTALHYSVLSGSIELLDLLVNQGLLVVDTENKEGYTPLQLAARAGLIEAADFLLSKAANPNHRDAIGFSPLHEAVIHNYPDMVSLLIEKGADVDIQVNKGNDLDATKGASSLHLTVLYNRFEILPILFDNKVFTARRNDDGYTAVMLAIEENNIEMLEELLTAGASVDNDIEFITPLEQALQKDDVAIAARLLDSGAEINRVNKKNETPIILALEDNKNNFVKLFLEKGASTDAVEGGINPLQLALELSNEFAVDLLMLAGADPNAPDRKGRTPLFVAAENENLSLAEMLIKHGANASFVSSTWKETPVQMMIDKKNIFMLAILINNGAPVTVETDFEKTPVAMAIEAGFPYLKYLLQASDLLLDSKDKNENSFLHYAVLENNDSRIIEELVKAGLDIEAVNSEGKTALHIAALKNNIECLKTLISLGAQINPLDNEGNTPFMVSKGESETVLSINGGKNMDEL